MTNHSYPIHSDEIAVSSASSGSSSASTSSTDVYPLPFSIGQKEIVLNNDERQLVSDASNNNFLTPGTNICVTDSTNVDIGNHTIFNEPVTIYQYVQGRTPNGAIVDEVECNKSVTSTLIIPENEKNIAKDKCRKHEIRRKICCFFTSFIMMTIILSIIILSFKIVILDDSLDFNITQVAEASETTGTATPGSDSDVFIPKEKWGGVDAINSTAVPPATLVIVKHTGGDMCISEEECRARVRDMQKEHMEIFKFPDISYNFLIGGDGKIYVGRGYNKKNEGRQDSLDIAFIGNFSIFKPSDVMIQRGLRIIIKGTSPNIHGINFSEFYVVSHNQTERTDSPGKYLFEEVTHWKFYDPSTYF